MKINKLLIILSLAIITFFVSCEEYEDSVVPGSTVSTDMNVVSFIADNLTEFEFSPLDTEFKLTVKRSNESGALEVPITIITNTDNSFTVPSSLSFAAGEDTTTLTIAINYENATFSKELEIGIKVGDANYNPYSSEYSEYYASIIILDWQKYAAGTYTSALFGSFTIDLYKLEGEDKYRFFDLYADSYDLTFGWEGDNAISFPDYKANDDGYFYWETGVWMDGFGAFTVLWDSSPTYTFYDAISSTFQLEGDWSATENADWGGWIDEYYEITSLY